MRGKRTLISLLLALAMCLSGLSTTVCAASDINYLALGDSITSGYGLDNPSTQGFVPQLAGKIGATSTTNLGESGQTASQLLSKLENDSGYQSAVRAADVITITIGGNDLIAAVYGYLVTIGALDADQAASLMNSGGIDLLDSSNETTAKILEKMAQYYRKFSDDSSFEDACTACVTYINMIAAKIKELNSDAVILVANQYNPYAGLCYTYETEFLNAAGVISNFFDAGVTYYNNQLSTYKSSDYTVVDVYTKFKNSGCSQTNANITSGYVNLDFHPNTDGHTAIAEVCKSYVSTVSSTLTDITSSNSSAIQMTGVAYTTTLTATKTGYALPDSVTVTVDGTALTAGTDYTYNSSTGELTIAASAVTDDIVITAAAIENVTVPTITAIAVATSDNSESEYISGTWTASKRVVITASGSTAVSDIEKYQYYNDVADEWVDMVGDKLTVAGMSDDSFVFRAVSKDGNYSAVSEPFVVKNDTSAPTISVSGDTATILSSDTAAITAADDQSGVTRVEVSADGGATYTDITDSYTGGYTVTANGDYIFRVTNGAGTTATASITYTTLTQKPPSSAAL